MEKGKKAIFMKQVFTNGRKQELAKLVVLGILAGGLAIPGRASAADLTVTTDQTGPVYAATGDGVESNNLTIGSVTPGPTITGSAYGGMGTSGGSYSDTNTVTLNNGTVTENLYGTYDPDIATYSTATINAGTVQGNVYGSYSQNGTADYNHVYVGTDTANTGTISISGRVYGANTPGGTTFQNVVTINSGTVAGTVYGGAGQTATYNEVHVNGGSLQNGLYGGYSTAGDQVNHNIITLSGGTISGTIYGGYAGAGDRKSVV